MLVLGLILLLVGWLVGIGVLELIGLILVIIGAVLLLAGGLGHPVGGRYWY